MVEILLTLQVACGPDGADRGWYYNKLASAFTE